MINFLIKSIPAIINGFFCFFIGAWSERRKYKAYALCEEFGVRARIRTVDDGIRMMGAIAMALENNGIDMREVKAALGKALLEQATENEIKSDLETE